MHNGKPLDVLIGLVRDQLDDSGRNLAQVTAQHQQSQSQLEALSNYRIDYSQQLQNTTTGGISSANYHNFRRFINNLDDAITQQKNIISKIELKLDDCRNQWLADKRKLNSYETLKSRQLNALKLHEQRKEQKISDELSAGMFRRQKYI